MPAKRHPKKTTRQKRLIHTVASINDEGNSLDRNSTSGREAEIIRQFHQIQKGYTRLLTDVAKELNLVKGWIGSQAVTKRNDLKARLSARLSRD
ncbi:MAG: hypothetical protein H7281_07870 [Bacteriovorax sp.]|nr:hypothetical protein [Bacteriovorax sp.]